MSLENRILDDYKRAMRERDEVRIRTLRLLRAAIKNARIEARAELDDDAVQRVIQSQIRRRRESIEGFQAAHRDDLVAREQADLAVLQEYLPEQLDEDAVRKLAAEVIAELGAGSIKDLGAVMRALMPRVRGRADGSQVNAIVRRLLGDG